MRDVIPRIPVRNEEILNKLVIQTLTTRKKAVNDRLLAAFENLVLYTPEKIVKMLEFINGFCMR